MTGMVRKALTIAAGLAVVASVASAGVPDNRFSTSDAVVVGNASGTAIGGAPAGFDVVVKDVNNAPLAGRTVTLDFSATPMKVFNAQNAGTTLNCAAKTISRVTNASGAVNFASRVAQVRQREQRRRHRRRRSALRREGSLDGHRRYSTAAPASVTSSIFSANFLAAPAAQETDFDLNGTTGLGDFSVFSSAVPRWRGRDVLPVRRSSVRDPRAE